MTRTKRFMLFLSLALLPGLVMAKGTITGKVLDSQSGEGLVGANITVVGTSLGAAADAKGNYTIPNVPDGSYTVKATFIGFDIGKQTVQISSSGAATADFSLTQQTIFSEGLEVTASRAKDRETPVAFTNVNKEQLSKELGSRDIPMVLNTTPSVYATQQGGGAGDARINVRGFNQRNIAVMINGVPVNDMENGWVYWSNWDGVGDATRSLQVQRGLGSTNLATPSIGGSLNIITDPTALERGGLYKQEFGNDGFYKSTLMYNTGLLGDKFALSTALVHKAGNGLIDGTWTDAYAYYAGASYNISRNNRIELYALGAPQRHGQNLYKQNIAVYNREFAQKLVDKNEYDPEAFTKFNEVSREFNQNIAAVDKSYSGQQFLGNLGNSFFLFGNDIANRHQSGFLMERENFFHKPQVNLNWFSQLSNRMNLYTVLYYSGGRGGGTGTKGSLVRAPHSAGQLWFNSSPWLWDWNATIARNEASTTGATGVLRNSRNNQWTVGAISKANYSFSDQFKFTFGVDWRTAEIDHFREVRDLLGGDYYLRSDSDFWTEAQQQRRLGDKIDFNFTNTVDWFGLFGQGEYSNGRFSAVGVAGWSTINYTYTNHFKDDGTGNELFSETPNITGFQFKGGANYNVTQNVNFFGNLGWIEKVPIFDHVINDRTGSITADPENEKFASIEAGVNFRTDDNRLHLKFNGYYTSWKDRSNTVSIINLDGSEGLISLTGLDLLHQGVEFEAIFQPNRYARFDGVVTFGDWKYTNDVSGTFKDYESGGAEEETFNYSIDGLRVGDAPQTQFVLSGSLFPTDGMSTRITFRRYDRHYAEWDPTSRAFDAAEPSSADRAQSWRTPSYNIFDVNVNYRLPVRSGNFQPTLFFHVFNLLDEIYIQDALDNSQFNSWDQDHDADSAEVFFGFPRSFNLGLSFTF